MMQNKIIIYIVTLVLLFLSGCIQFGEPSIQVKQQKLAQQQCLDNIGQAAIERLVERSEAFDAEIEALCKAGERELAQSKAELYSQQLLDDPVTQALQKCGKDLMVLLPSAITKQDAGAIGQIDNHTREICDQQPRPKKHWRQFTVWP
jgi:hypothetical protein